MAKKPIPLDVDEEAQERAKFGGMTKAEISAVRSAIATQKEKSATASGDLSAKLEIFEKKGGNKRGMKKAASFLSQESDKAMDEYRAMNAYLEAEGFFDQMDMLDQESERQKNADSIAIASQPAEGAEPQEAVH